MAIMVFGFPSWRPQSSCLRPRLVYFSQKIRWSCAAVAMEMVGEPEYLIHGKINGNIHSTKKRSPEKRWKRLSSKELGITTSMIPKSTRVVLDGIKEKGYDVYLVGGCVRDLLLKRTPKDFDILTSAELKDVLRTFRRCEIIGRRFPICHVRVGDDIVEVSSFSTTQRRSNYSMDLRYSLEKPVGCDEKDYMRWKNCLRRDFTINGLIFDPYAKLVYDYVGGLEDARKAKVRAIIPARTSFVEDSARILRAIRITARLGFRLARGTAQSVKSMATTIQALDKTRLLMEMNYMLAYGSAEASLRLLWKFGLLEILLPIQAAYFVGQRFRRRDSRSNMLLTLFSNLDKLVAPDRPCDSSLWLAILAFHKGLLDKPRDPLVVATFCLAVHNGGDLSEATEIARKISSSHSDGFCELSRVEFLGKKALHEEVMELADYVKQALSTMTNEYAVSKAMAVYPQAPCSDLVFIPVGLYLRVARVFECVIRGKEKRFTPKKGTKIDYEMLAVGSLEEVRHVFARVVFDTIYPLD